MNLMYNLTNPYQGNARKVLCLCSAGLLRSPTAAVVLQQEYGYNTRSAGVNSDYALIVADEVLCSWAEEIVVMEEYMIDYLETEFRHKVTILNIEDNYSYMDPTLIRLIKEKYEESNNV